MRLRSDRRTPAESYDVVVVGSGYGAGVLAARLARGGELSVCVLERGREYLPGEFPTRLGGLYREFQIDRPAGRSGSRLGLFDLRVNPELSVLVGCGLGGTSLINANVTIRPSRRVFEDPAWPAELRAHGDGGHALDPYFALARAMLRPTQADPARLAKLRLLEQCADATGAPFHRAEVNVCLEPRAADPIAGVREQPACNHCGNCVTGCNVGAKNTLCYTYLPLARRDGADIYTRCAVRRIERAGERWLVHYQRIATGSEADDAPTHQVRARVVVLGAGSLGSTEILMRSELPVSRRLGHRFSGNGDSFALGYCFDQDVDSVGFGRRPRRSPLVGPTITGVVDLRSDDRSRPLSESIVIEEGAFPGSTASVLRYLIEALAIKGGEPSVPIRTWLGRRWRELLDLLGADPLDGVLNHSQLYLGMGHDGAGGELQLADGRLRVVWPDANQLPVFAHAEAWTDKLTLSQRAKPIHNPLIHGALFDNMISVHPLGGCSLADDPDHGVVNHRGQVFTRDGGVFDTLFVADGAIVPTSVGVNPLWTITALAERIADLARRQLELPA